MATDYLVCRYYNPFQEQILRRSRVDDGSAAIFELSGGFFEEAVMTPQEPVDSDPILDEEFLRTYVPGEGVCDSWPSGLSKEEVDRYLVRKDRHRSRGPVGDRDICVVCQDTLLQKEKIVGTLDCGHDFHVVCIKQWLRRRNLCPLCKSKAIRPEEK